ncbi:hypothetical protein NCC49_002711 [Naganishia albida]|nr:hypothetical protein NCC49_002711 [Naganishia albida]
MATQLRAASAALRSTLTYQSNRVLASSLVRQASTYTQPSRANGFSFKPRNGEQDARQRVPTARFGMRDPMEGVDGRRERFGSERGFDRSSGRDRTSDGGRRFTVMREEGGNDPFRRRQTMNREERRPHGEGKPYNRTVQPNSYGDRKSFDKPVYEGRRTFERSRPERPYGKRKSEESGEADITTSKKPIDLEKRLRIRPGTSPYDASVHLNNYIRKARAPKHGTKEATNADYLQIAEEILKTAPRESVNVAVWNVLLAGFAKERKYQRMFKAFNDMKKRGIRPSSRTYAIMLDNYPSSFDAPAKTLSRATLLFDQAQEHVHDVLGKIAEAKESEGYELSTDRSSGGNRPQPDADSGAGEDDKGHLRLDAYTSGNAVAPTNAYLAQMTHFARFDEVRRVYEAMPKEGPRAPDGKTYTILFEACMAAAGKQRSGEVTGEASDVETVKPAVAAEGTQEMLVDPVALWKEIVDRDTDIRRKIGKGAKSSQRAGPRLMDEQQAPLLDDRLVITALRCFMSGPVEQRTFALDQVVPSVYNLSAPGRSAYSSSVIPENSARFEITERAVETILKLCLAAGRAREGAHYAEQILNMPKAFTDQLMLTHYNAILALYSKENDIDKCLEILDMKPPFLRGEAWPRSSWIYALKAAKFAGDWEKFLVAFKRMTRIPAVLEGKAASGIGSEKVDDQIAHLLLATATESKKVSAMRDAMRIFAYYYTGRKPASPSANETSTYSRYWRRQLLASLESCLSAIENAGQDASSGKDPNEERAWHALVGNLGSDKKENVHAPARGRTPERPRNYGEHKGSPRPQHAYMHR